MAAERFWQRWPISLRWAVGLSLAIHGLLIFPVAYVFYTPIAMPQAPLSAVLKGPGDVTHAAPVESKRFVPVSAGDAGRTSKKVPVKPLPVRDEAQARSAAKTPAQAVAGVIQGDASALANAASRTGVVGGAPDVTRDGVEADVLAKYRLALAVSAKKAWRKPYVEHSEPKICRFDVLLSRNGGVPSIVLVKSSGIDKLDDAALSAFRIAVSRTAIPPELQGKDRRISLQMTIETEEF